MTLSAANYSMKQIILFSDIHLPPASENNHGQQDFISFLRSIDVSSTEQLICLGDLFDFWFEYRHAIFSGYYEVLRCFSDLKDAGVALHLVCGNHDFWAGDFLKNQIGFHIHHDRVEMTFGQRKALLFHGDGLNPHDYGYRGFKVIARNRLARGLFRHIHPDVAMALAQMLSRGSRRWAQTHERAQHKECDVIRNHAHQLLHETATDIVICGHSHVPAIEVIPRDSIDGLYVNPGDWPRHRSYVVYCDEEFSMHSFC